MTATAAHPDDLRAEAARLAFALLRFEGVAAHPMRGAATPDAYVFLPSWREVPGSEVEAFLVGLPSPALLLPTTLRGTIALLLLHELTGDRRRWAEKALSNFAAGLDELAPQLGLAPGLTHPGGGRRRVAPVLLCRCPRVGPAIPGAGGMEPRRPERATFAGR